MHDIIELSDHFDYKRLLRFTLPSILMMILTSIYGVVDGFFVSNFVGKTAFAAVNFIMPFLMVVGATGFMLGTGGSALIAKTLGEGDSDKAQRIFSLVVCATIICGCIIALFSISFLRFIASALGAEGAMLENCVAYGRIILVTLPFLMLQYAFSSLAVTAQRARLGLVITVAAGLINAVGDVFFMVVLPWGIEGAALASALGELAGGLVPLLYFARKNSSLLRLCRPHFDKAVLFKVCTNGSSELMSNISMSVVGMLYNAQLMKYVGEDGVAAYGTIMYVDFVFLAIFIGYATGVIPVISYHYGAGNRAELNNLLRKSGAIILAGSMAMLIISHVFPRPLAAIFVGYDAKLLDMTVEAFKIYAFSFLLAGFSIFGSAFFTALNDGLTSAVISFMRTLVFESMAVLVIPLFMGAAGIWYSINIAEFMAVCMFGYFLISKNKIYGYW